MAKARTHRSTAKFRRRQPRMTVIPPPAAMMVDAGEGETTPLSSSQQYMQKLGVNSNWLKRQQRQEKTPTLSRKAAGIRGRIFQENPNIVKSRPQPFPTLEEARKAPRDPLWPRVVAIDCEMVESIAHTDMLAKVAVVAEDGVVLLQSLVRPTQRVLDFRAAVTGLSAAMLNSAPSFESVTEKVRQALSECVVVGHSVKSDLAVLGIDATTVEVRDTAKYPPLFPVTGEAVETRGPPALRYLSANWLHRPIQTGVHCPVEDARAAMDLYLLHRPVWEWEVREVARLAAEKIAATRAVKNPPKRKRVKPKKGRLGGPVHNHY